MHPQPAHHHHSMPDHACRDACIACATTCSEMLYAHCLPIGGDHAAPDHVRLMIDCAAICETAAGFLTRGSSQHVATCRACATVCRACAESCRQLDGMEACVEACERCEAACRAMAQPVG